MNLRLALGLVILLAAGCASVPATHEPSAAERDAVRLVAEGRHDEAARIFERLAAEARGNARHPLALRAAEAWQAAGQPERARAALSQVNARRLPAADLARHDLLQADVALAAGDAGSALMLLGEDAARIPDALRLRWHLLRADALRAEGRHFAAAGERVRADALLADDARARNRRDIERLLARLDDNALARASAALSPDDPLYPYAGRALTARGLPLPHPYRRSDAPVPPAARPPAEADGYRPPLKLAVLVPLSGPLAGAGASVRDGALSAHFGEPRRRPEMRFYDTAGTADGALEAYRRALADGADQVLGPLSRDEVTALFSQPSLAAPVLALNRSQLPPPPGSASFALSPEDEGIAAAERLLRRGLIRVVVVGAGDDNAQRSLDAFREHFLARGGEILAEARLPEGQMDYSSPLREALAAAGGGQPVPTDTTQTDPFADVRGGIHDAVFVALRGPQARLLVPQLALAGYANRPMVATSLILQGSGDPRLDRELDGIEFPESPWLLGSRSDLPDPVRAGRRLASARGPAARLFAFGLDGYRLAGYLEHLARQSGAWINGATGELRLDAFGNVLRIPAWGVFSGGRTRPALDGALTPDAEVR